MVINLRLLDIPLNLIRIAIQLYPFFEILVVFF